MFAKITFALLTLALATGAALAQAPAPVVVQPMPAVAQAAAAQSQPAPAAAATDSPAKMIEEMKASNEAILKQQAATLLQLDEIQKAAEQLRIYSKRG